jgi:hypothetical protein
MFYGLCLDEEDHAFGHIGCMVGDALDVAGEDEKMCAWFDQLLTGLHFGHKVGKQRTIKGVHHIIASQNALREDRVIGYQRFKAVPNHDPGDLGHLGEPGLVDEIHVRHQRVHALGNVDRNIPNPFQLAIDVQGRNEEAEIHSDRLSECKQPLALFLNPRVELIDITVLRNDPKCSIPVGGEQSVIRLSKLVVDQLTHLRQCRPEMLQLVLKVTFH